jgi:hypothetical protein
MRLPKDLDEGTFSLDCPNCDKELEFEIKNDRGTPKVLRINGKPYIPPRKRSLKLGDTKKPERKVVVAELPIEMELPHHKRLRVVAFILLLVFVLGIFSSGSTLLGAFSIKDLEEKSPNTQVTLSVWVIDADTGRPIEDVFIELISGNKRFNGTSNTGGLVVINIVPGEMELTIEKQGYKTIKSPITIKKGSPNVIDVPMEKGQATEEIPILVHQFRQKTYETIITNIAAGLMLLSSVMAFISFIFVYRKEFFSMTLFTAFLSVFSFGFFLGSILAFLAVVLIILSYRGFTHTHILEEMLANVRSSRDLKNALKGDNRKFSGLPPVREP